ncbi:MAG: type II toxin-antitoxin system VapC family toxin [Acidaminococcaceae bacterium]|nr:type II toxin-antitoxin system VapC family toxin [Acidaminococcaceae bacterium]
MYLLDTNICIYFLKNTYPTLTERLLSFNPTVLLISSVTVFELAYGAEKSNWGERTRQKLALFLAPFNILPFTSEDAIAAGRIRSSLEKQGSPIGPYDVQIAAQAYSRGLILVTHNTGEFCRIPDLKLEDWAG